MIISNNNPTAITTENLSSAIIIRSSKETVFISKSIEISYDKGKTFAAFGEAKAIPNQELTALGAKRHYVNGDGSCWARALWQSTFSQIFATDIAFENFIQKVAASQQVRGYEVTLNKTRAKETIYILHQLKPMSESDRLSYLNHFEVDNSLVFFMRDVASEYMKYQYETSDADVRDIKRNKNRYGAQEITAFCNYFELKLERISRNSQGIWTYYDYDGKRGTGNHKPIADLIKEGCRIPYNCMFGINEVHYEYISFDCKDEQTKLIDSQKLEHSFHFLAAEIKEQIDQDHQLALELQKEFNVNIKKAEGNPTAFQLLKTAFEKTLRERFGLESSALQPSNQLIKSGNQTGCNAVVDTPVISAIHHVINQRAVQGVAFAQINPNERNTIQGGTCSAMSLNFLHQFFRFFEMESTSLRDMDFITTASIIDQMDKRHFKTNQLMRNIQAAFNTIKRDSEVVSDFGKAKMESLSTYFALKILESSAEIDLDNKEKAEIASSTVFKTLNEGVYLIRQIAPDESPKGEKHGHTTALIRLKHHSFYYDPNYGVTQIIDATGKNLFEHLNKSHRTWDVPKARLYRVERDQALLAQNIENSLPESPKKTSANAAVQKNPKTKLETPKKTKATERNKEKTFSRRLFKLFTRISTWFKSTSHNIIDSIRRLFTRT